jgi:oxygen-independent coproporphyrinogen-3 oxidase
MRATIISVMNEQQAGWPRPASLYLHIPFCPSKCPYCDFVSYVGGTALIEPYVAALCAEITRVGQQYATGPLNTVYLGGGTPSLLTPAQIDRILCAVDQAFGIAANAELSMEANPGTVDVANLAEYRSAGLNRISFGGQSMDDAELKRLGRQHSAIQVYEAFQAARAAGFDNVNLDFMYGTPGQTLASWQRTLEIACALAPEHLSLYPLTIEPHTEFARHYDRGLLGLPSDEEVVTMYYLACALLREHGYEHYEVANWSRPGRQCRHNLTYWRNEEFFAAGVGAHGYLRPVRFAHVRGTKRYIELILAGEEAIASREHVGLLDERFESVVMPLRLLREGFDTRIYRARFNERFEDRYGEVLTELEPYGFFEQEGPIIRLREEMVPVANEAWEHFLPDPVAA